jgi:hypothetical protein
VDINLPLKSLVQNFCILLKALPPSGLKRRDSNTFMQKIVINYNFVFNTGNLVEGYDTNYWFAIKQLCIKCNDIPKITPPLASSKIRGFKYSTTRWLADTGPHPDFFSGVR